jgi:hypothetical protein
MPNARSSQRLRRRPLYVALAVIVTAWVVVWAGYVLARKSRMTFAKVSAYQSSLDLSKLSAAERRAALKKLVDELNAMSPEERAKWHLDRDWFSQLTEEEKSWFIEAVVPGELKIALNIFERLPREQQQKQIDQALAELRRNAANPQVARGAGPDGTPLISPDLDKKIRTMGLNTLYSSGSAQTKAELAPLLIEVQHQMESGQLNVNGF